MKFSAVKLCRHRINENAFKNYSELNDLRIIIFIQTITFHQYFYDFKINTVIIMSNELHILKTVNTDEVVSELHPLQNVFRLFCITYFHQILCQHNNKNKKRCQESQDYYKLLLKCI